METAGTCAVQTTHETDQRMERRRAHTATSASWPATTAEQTAKSPRKNKKTAFRALSLENQQKFKDALKNKHNSAEDFIRYRCVNIKRIWMLGSIEERFSDTFVHSVYSLWKSSGGACAATGVPMVWSRDDTRDHPDRTVTIVEVDPRCAFGAGNVALVCGAIAAFVRLHGGIAAAQCVALDMEAFVSFKRGRGPEHFTSACAAWDAECTRMLKTHPWEVLTSTERTLFLDRMRLACAHMARDESQTDAEIALVASRALFLIDAQAGRCAVSGRRLTIQQGSATTRASIDRMDSERHSPENIRLTTWTMNTARLCMPDDVFDEWVLRMAMHSRGRAHRGGGGGHE
jgi:hypothetical protein